MSILIKNGRLIDPSQKLDKTGDILIEKGKISKVGGSINAKGAETIDAKGKIVAPGFCDMHAHLREPGGEDREHRRLGHENGLAVDTLTGRPVRRDAGWSVTKCVLRRKGPSVQGVPCR